MIGNQKKWREGETLTTAIFLPELNTNINLNASWHSRENNEVQLSWDAENITFLSILNAAGEMPIPPYLNREANEDDASQYQTVYAKHHGAVAAPTAGLHFTDTVLHQLQNNQISQTEVTLHVSAGTFQPIKETADVQHHNMHAEQIIVYKKTIELLLNSIGKTVVVGTTSMRTLESLYWYGVKLMLLPHAPFFIEKLFSKDVYIA
jgi:S-adenosylmethionine:tRNA ribosyltransferase-isomerase